MTTILPEPVPADPAAAALDMFTELPGLAGAKPGHGLHAIYQDLAGIMQLEGILDGMDWNDARATIAALGIDLMFGDLEKILTRAAWIRSREEGAHPLHEPERVAVALERVYAITQQPLA